MHAAHVRGDATVPVPQHNCKFRTTTRLTIDAQRVDSTAGHVCTALRVGQCHCQNMCDVNMKFRLGNFVSLVATCKHRVKPHADDDIALHQHACILLY